MAQALITDRSPLVALTAPRPDRAVAWCVAEIRVARALPAAAAEPERQWLPALVQPMATTTDDIGGRCIPGSSLARRPRQV